MEVEEEEEMEHVDSEYHIPEVEEIAQGSDYESDHEGEYDESE